MSKHFTYRPALYFAITFAATFVLLFAAAYVSHRDELSGMTMALIVPGMCAPFAISLVMVLKSNHPALKKDFLNRLWNPRLVRLNMLPVILLLMPITVLVSILISLPFGGSVDQFQFANGFSFSAGAFPVLLLLFMAALFEELGWRGYAFDSLQSRFSFLNASLVFSVLWSLWHLPMLWVKDSYQYEILHQNPWFALNFFVSLLPMGVILSWICVKNRKSMIAAILFHFLLNVGQEVLSMTQATKCIETAVLFVIAAVIVVSDQKLFRQQQSLPAQPAIEPAPAA
jgi:membrane protease YdiL (CAAX protease family)